MEEILPLEVEATCDYEVGYKVKATKPFKIVRDVRGRLRIADLPPALECLEADRCARKKVPCLQAIRKHPEAYANLTPEDLKEFKDYLNPSVEAPE